MDSKYYFDILRRLLDSNNGNLLDGNLISQQENELVYASSYMRELMNTSDKYELDWNARSPDLNIVGKFWGFFLWKFYRNGCQFNDIRGLQEQIMLAWNCISTSYTYRHHFFTTSLSVLVVENGACWPHTGCRHIVELSCDKIPCFFWSK